MSEGTDEGANEGAERPKVRFRTAWHTEDSYGWVFIMLTLDVVLLITLPNTDWSRVVQVLFVALTLVLALRTSSAPVKLLRLGEIGGAVAVIASVAISAMNLERGSGVIYLIMAALLFVTPLSMFRELLSRERVTARVLVGALSIYLMIGLFFAFLFLGIAVMNDGAFFSQGPSVHPADYVYFSYVTMLTIGYGDLSPATHLGRMLSVMDGLIGQVFLVTTIARLVSMYGGGPSRRPYEKE